MGNTAMPVQAMALVPTGKRDWVQADPGMNRLFKLLEAGPAKAPAIEGAAELAMVSESTLKRHIRELTGFPWSGFVREWRLLNAWVLLALTERPSQLVMSLIGLKSSSSFARAFKKRFGWNPSEVHEAVLQGQVTTSPPSQP